MCVLHGLLMALGSSIDRFLALQDQPDCSSLNSLFISIKHIFLYLLLSQCRGESFERSQLQTMATDEVEGAPLFCASFFFSFLSFFFYFVGNHIGQAQRLYYRSL